jgi:phosphate:Na+ symporter
MNTEALSILGGSALLVYGMQELSKSIQYVAGGRFRTWINEFGRKPILGLLLGLLLSVLLSGSGAVTAMLVGLANARLLTLEQVFAVTLGSAVGTTFIVHLLALKIADYGLLIVFGGMVLGGLVRDDRTSKLARCLFFLGLIFFSISLLVGAGKQLQDTPWFINLLEYFMGRPFVAFLFSAVLTAIIPSSSATIVFVMSIFSHSNAGLSAALPWILGANVGTTANGFYASYGTGQIGKQAALGHFLFKVIAVVLFLPFTDLFVTFISSITHDLSRQIAGAHTLFNVISATVLFPFIPWGVQLVRKIIPDELKQSPFHYHFLDVRSLPTPEVALAQAQKELMRMAELVENMVSRSITLFNKKSIGEIEELKSDDSLVDYLNRGIKLFLTKLSQNEMTPEQVQKEFELVVRTHDLENIGDIVDKNLLELVRKTVRKGYVFSESGWQEILTLHEKVIELLRISTAYFNARDRSLFVRIMVLNREIEELVIELSERHVQRLHQGIKQSLDTTSVHLDILSSLQRIAHLSINFTRVIGSRQSDIAPI